MNRNLQKQRVKEITEQLEQGIKHLFESEQNRKWLITMSRLHQYSLNNTILICMQKPDASLVAGFHAWKKMGRHVKKGEKGILILAPIRYTREQPNAEEDPLESHETEKEKTEKKEIICTGYKIVSVFDVSQTEGRELPSIGVNELTGDVETYQQFFEALKMSCPVPIEFESIRDGAKGYFHQTENRIAIQEGMSQVQTLKTVIHEMAHQKLHSIQGGPADLTPVQRIISRNAKEVEAESVAFTVCQHYGIDTSDYSFAYIASWSEGKDTSELKQSMDIIRKAASEMIRGIDRNLPGRRELQIELEKENEEKDKGKQR